MLAIAGFSLFITFTAHDKLMLLGTEYHEITPATAQNPAEQQLYNIIEENEDCSRAAVYAARLYYRCRLYECFCKRL